MQTSSYVTEVTLWAVFTTWMVKHAALGACTIGLFGHLCQYQCHCQHGAACHPTTGACFDKCEAGWTGPPTCQTKNVALDQITYQSGYNTSALAVDGTRTQDGSTNKCSRAVGTPNPFRVRWYVDLGKPNFIKRIRIFFRNDMRTTNIKRRQGVRVYVSDTPEFTKGALCFTSQIGDKSFYTPPDILVLDNCTHKARYVTVFNQRPMVDSTNCPATTYSCWANLELCEVEVYSCEFGTYGENCENYCHCKQSTCDPKTGICPSGCTAGRMGPRCDKPCPAGRYGYDCSKFCTNCDNDIACDVVSGQCPLGCKPGWRGGQCNIPCPKYRYGQDCSQACIHCKGRKDCDKVTGVCPDGCRVNWHGPTCNSSCPLGMHGEKCDRVCGKCAGGASCFPQNGYCPGDCQPGYTGRGCSEKCIGFTFGKDCTSKCGNCVNGQPCDHVSGICTNGCMSGYNGTKCLNACTPGFYGENCRRTCDNCLDNVCNSITGDCTRGCAPGYQNNPSCDKVCPKGMYGPQCVSMCGPCLNHAPCDPITGECFNGCEPGWKGSVCRKACPNGTYGRDCKLLCGHCKNATECYHIDGRCPLGCEKEYMGTDCQSLAVNEDITPKIKLAGMIGGIIAAIVLLSIMILVCTIRRSRRSNKNKSPETESRPVTRETSDGDNLYENTRNIGYICDSEDEEATPNSNIRLSTVSTTYCNVGVEQGVNIAALNDYISTMEADPDRYSVEFEEIQKCPAHPHLIGQKKENKAKNRFITTFPYDHSRVVLEDLPDEPNSDYINANFIDSVDKEKAYIATQGPNRVTVRDFWRMVWQEKVSQIIMLANLFEDGKTKCERYWPDKQPMNCCGLLITLHNTTELFNYTIRDISVRNMKIKSHVKRHCMKNPTLKIEAFGNAKVIAHRTSEWRRVIQFHFTGWPDHGVPDTLELVTFLGRFHTFPVPDAGPILVHCSAGVGRTGTFIALDALHKHGLSTQNVDIQGFVKKMRENRMKMIQNIDQYRLLHFALLEAFTYRNSAIKKSEFLTNYTKLKSEDSTTISEEFQNLLDTKPKYSNSDCMGALVRENVEKNRSLDVLAVDRFRPYLNTHITGTNDYINAVIIPTCKAGSKYYTTQCPLLQTVVDFWRLVCDHDITTIVALNILDEDKEGTVVWWPSEGESVKYGPLTISTTSVSDIQMGFSERTFTLKRRDSGETRKIKSFHLATWPVGKDIPQSSASLLSMINAAENWKRRSVSESVLIQCMDGARYCGIYCAISLVLDRMKLEEEVDIYHTIRRLQVRRPEVITNIEQYSYLYDVIAEYLDSTNVYANL